jgi:hypothetical protein
VNAGAPEPVPVVVVGVVVEENANGFDPPACPNVDGLFGPDAVCCCCPNGPPPPAAFVGVVVKDPPPPPNVNDGPADVGVGRLNENVGADAGRVVSIVGALAPNEKAGVACAGVGDVNIDWLSVLGAPPNEKSDDDPIPFCAGPNGDAPISENNPPGLPNPFGSLSRPFLFWWMLLICISLDGLSSIRHSKSIVVRGGVTGCDVIAELPNTNGLDEDVSVVPLVVVPVTAPNEKGAGTEAPEPEPPKLNAGLVGAAGAATEGAPKVNAGLVGATAGALAAVAVAAAEPAPNVNMDFFSGSTATGVEGDTVDAAANANGVVVVAFRGSLTSAAVEAPAGFVVCPNENPPLAPPNESLGTSVRAGAAAA